MMLMLDGHLLVARQVAGGIVVGIAMLFRPSKDFSYLFTLYFIISIVSCTESLLTPALLGETVNSATETALHPTGSKHNNSSDEALWIDLIP